MFTRANTKLMRNRADKMLMCTTANMKLMCTRANRRMICTRANKKMMYTKANRRMMCTTANMKSMCTRANRALMCTTANTKNYNRLIINNDSQKHNYICKYNNLPTTCFDLIRPSSGWNTASYPDQRPTIEHSTVLPRSRYNSGLQLQTARLSAN